MTAFVPVYATHENGPDDGRAARGEEGHRVVAEAVVEQTGDRRTRGQGDGAHAEEKADCLIEKTFFMRPF